MSHCFRSGRTLQTSATRLLCLLVLTSWGSVVFGQGESLRMAEPLSDQRVFSSQAQVTTNGKVQTAKAGGGKDELDLNATAQFDFTSRRLPPAGRDAEAHRELRQFTTALLDTDVAGHATKIQLPADRQVIVASGSREGVVSYSPSGPLTSEAVDLLEIPGDPLALQGVLPVSDVRLGEEWSPADWVLQMLTGVEAVESSQLKCKLEQATPTAAKITFKGSIKGQRLGVNTSVEIAGALIFNLEENYISQARTVYAIASDIGAVNPGLSIRVNCHLKRAPGPDAGSLTDALVQSIPLEIPQHALDLQFVAAPWGLALRHARDWHLFQAVYDTQAPVAILRLVNLGSLIAQCNLSPVAPSPAGQTVPLEQFEADIQQSLGKRFRSITTREQIPTTDGRRIFRVAATGEVDITGASAAVKVPMVWIYYLVAHPDGRQASFVFSIEPELLEQLQDRDQEIAKGLQFLPHSGPSP